jgi:hypothetical protein
MIQIHNNQSDIFDFRYHFALFYYFRTDVRVVTAKENYRIISY